jgi:hypothetical protein
MVYFVMGQMLYVLELGRTIYEELLLSHCISSKFRSVLYGIHIL